MLWGSVLGFSFILFESPGFRNYLHASNFQSITSLDFFLKLQTFIFNLSKSKFLIFLSISKLLHFLPWLMATPIVCFLRLKKKKAGMNPLFFHNHMQSIKEYCWLYSQRKCRIRSFLNTNSSHYYYPGPCYCCLLRLLR